MEIYTSEEQQVEAIKRFWNQYGKAILGGVVIGLTSLYGWRYFQAEQRASAEALSNSYAQLVQQQGNNEEWLTQAQRFIGEQGSNNYAIFAALLSAKEAVNAGDFQAASNHLNWAQQNSKDANVKAIAQIRLARVQRETGDLAAALATLNQTMPASFAAQQAELKGDILQASGDLAAAKAAFQQALAQAGDNTQLLQIKLDELAHITAAN
ncbi:membrane protein [Alishewanella longhuensis]|uniref:Ancillary SecYEG translocon subunit n=1 Tax=Alishewanella longhuensis TaxID=1091037 RepID=A0ABQ3KUP8_9ALTE|nr:tetratricopeptide repeat protein [Alishewanella longhuensis]GHG62327.1 membrane protein [Alishewanella longhuensis]